MQHDIDLGHVYYSDNMGTDASIVEAARASYKKGTRSTSDDKSLLRYLYRHEHFSPFSMAQLKLHFKLPMFVFNQFVRHDRFHWNVESGRYSEMSDDFWMPSETNVLRGQGSSGNKQVGDGVLSLEKMEEAEYLLATQEMDSRETYKKLLEIGVCREQARTVISMGQYIECYATANLGDWLLLLSKRLPSNAQRENTVYAEAIASIISELFPLSYAAFEDYKLNSISFSREELVAVAPYLLRFLEAFTEAKGQEDLEKKESSLDSLFKDISNKTERKELIQKLNDLTL